jgi:hypothetical protein
MSGRPEVDRVRTHGAAPVAVAEATRPDEAVRLQQLARTAS